MPSSSGWAPVSALISVDLPAPFSPMSECTSPPYIRKSTPSSAVSLPKRTVAPCISTNGDGSLMVTFCSYGPARGQRRLDLATIARCTTTKISSRAPIVMRVQDCSAPRYEIAVLIMP